MKAADRRRLANSLIRRGTQPIVERVRRELGHLPSVTTEHYVRSADAPAPADEDRTPEVP
ncbi:hypothetical protein [Streptomyces globosus]|uniref:hypothetical protein n=1 Tax=Streptomyces globosus TaxID=68209 RepID=UPI0031DB6B7C